MTNPFLDDTQPVSTGNKVINSQTQPVKTTVPGKSRSKLTWLWVFLGVMVVSLAVAGGALAGVSSGQQEMVDIRAQRIETSLKEQYDLGIKDMADGRYEIARQRFDYVFNQDPGYPGLTENMAAVLIILYATATPTPLTPTPTITPVPPTPTRDMRPVEDRLTSIERNLKEGKWSTAIDSVINLRKDEPGYQTTRLDGFLYLAFRQLGIDKIYRQSDLQGGIYDLSLAENFGPLDFEADVARNMARLYLYGSSFWEAYPEKAVYFFSQVASAAPYLRDGSGWTATARYRAALIQYGDQLAQQGEWCSAVEQYQLASGISSDAALSTKISDASDACSPPTATLQSLSPTPTVTLTPTWTSVATLVNPPTPTETPEPPPSDTPTSEPPTSIPPTDTPSPELPTDTPPVPPSDTPAP